MKWRNRNKQTSRQADRRTTYYLRSVNCELQKLFFLVLLLMFALNVPAQKKIVIGPEEVTGLVKEKMKMKIDSLVEFGKATPFLITDTLPGNIQKTKMDANLQAIKLSESIHYAEGRARAIRSIAWIDFRKWDDQLTFSHLRKLDSVLTFFSIKGDKKEMALTHFTIYLLNWIYNWESAASSAHIFKAIRLWEETGEWDKSVIGWMDLGWRSLYWLDHKLALTNFRNALTIRIKQGNKLDIAETYSLLGDAYLHDFENMDSAGYYYRKALAIAGESAEKSRDTTILWLFLHDIYAMVLFQNGFYYLQNFQPQKAKGYFLEAIKAQKDKSFPTYQILAVPLRIYLGGALLELNELHDAEIFLRKALKDLNDIHTSLWNWQLNKAEPLDFFAYYDIQLFFVYLRDVHHYLAELYLKQKKETEAKYHLQLALFNEDMIGISRFWDLKDFQGYNRQIRIREAELMKKSAAIRQLELQKQKAVLWLMGSSLAMIIVILGIVGYRFRLKQKLYRQLKTKIREALEREQQQQQVIVHQSTLTAMGEMVAGMAHEINQPLQTILLSAETIYQELNTEYPDNKYIARNSLDQLRDVNRIREIMDHLHQFSNPNKMVESEFFNVNDCIRNGISMMLKQLENHGISMQFELGEPLLPVSGNPLRFEQVVVNLLNNARDAVDEKQNLGGEGYSKEIGIRTLEENHRVVMEIRDNGTGIPGDKLTRIFLPFFTTKDPGKGTGLGLSISWGIIREMNGTIDVESRPGEGTKFIISLPSTPGID